MGRPQESLKASVLMPADCWTVRPARQYEAERTRRISH
jgi:hypothetical protein